MSVVFSDTCAPVVIAVCSRTSVGGGGGGGSGAFGSAGAVAVFGAAFFFGARLCRRLREQAGVQREHRQENEGAIAIEELHDDVLPSG